MKAHADVARGADLVVDAAVVGIEVEVVGRSSAAREHQFGQGREGAGIHSFSREAGPDGVQSAQPVKQFGILGARQRPGQALVEMMVAVHQPGQHDHARRVDDMIGRGRQFVAGVHLASGGPRRPW